MNSQSIKIRVVRVRQPIGEFFVGSICPRDLCHISQADVRRLEGNEIDAYIGIQRRLNPKRVNDIKDYVERYDATFPTGVILAIPEENACYSESDCSLDIFATDGRVIENVASIIDGQHRVAGLQEIGDHALPFDVPVSIFIGADIPTQANIFATVNLAQTKVNKSLVYDLLDYETKRSPEKTAHDIAVMLDQHEASPMRRRIKRLGFSERGPDENGMKTEIVTQAVIVEGLAPLISASVVPKRGLFRSNKASASASDLKTYPFALLYGETNDVAIAQSVMNYFRAVEERWSDAWNDMSTKGNVLPKTNGIKALIRFLRLAHSEVCEGNYYKVPSQGEYLQILSKVKLNSSDFNIETFPPGSSGEARLFNILKEAIPSTERQSSLFD